MKTTFQVVFQNAQGQWGTLVITEDEALAREAYEVHRKLAVEQNKSIPGQLTVQDIELRRTDVIEQETWTQPAKVVQIPRPIALDGRRPI